jgi:parallel beta-helix repeat protein
MNARALAGILVVASLGVDVAQAEDISGNIAATKMLFEDSQLTGDVTCTVTDAPCIQFAADDIALKLNRFSITGVADANTGCGGIAVVNENGIDTNGRHSVEIEGPGLVQQFRFSGINVTGSTKVKVKRVTVSTNCFAGISVFGSSDNDFEENVAIKNGNIPNGCGGIELVPLNVGGVLVGSNSNRIKNNLVSGNGYSSANENDFGIALNSGNNNLVEKNTVVGNTVGIRIGPTVVGNVVIENVVVGNPPIQVSNSFPATAALRADIRNLSPAGANSFEKNYCLTYIGPGPAPCPNFPW